MIITISEEAIQSPSSQMHTFPNLQLKIYEIKRDKNPLSSKKAKRLGDWNKNYSKNGRS